MRSLSGALIAGTLLTFGSSTNGEPTSCGETVGRWEELPLPAAKDAFVSSMGVEPGDIPWITVSTSVYFWDGRQFRPPVTEEAGSSR